MKKIFDNYSKTNIIFLALSVSFIVLCIVDFLYEIPNHVMITLSIFSFLMAIEQFFESRYLDKIRINNAIKRSEETDDFLQGLGMENEFDKIPELKTIGVHRVVFFLAVAVFIIGLTVDFEIDDIITKKISFLTMAFTFLGFAFKENHGNRIDVIESKQFNILKSIVKKQINIKEKKQ